MQTVSTAVRWGPSHAHQDDINHATAMVEHAVDAFRYFNAKIDTVDSHFDKWAADRKLKDDEEPFVYYLFYGSVRHKPVLTVLLNALYHACGAELPRSAHDTLLVIAYCVLFRAEDLGNKRLEAVMQATELARTHTLLTFLLDREQLDRWCVEQWAKAVDRDFIQNKLLGRLKKQEPFLRRFMQRTAQLAFGAERAGSAPTGASGTGARGMGTGMGAGAGAGSFGASGSGMLGTGALAETGAGIGPPSASGALEQQTKASSASRKKKVAQPTVPRPFALTKPRPRVVPAPERVPTQVTLKPVPASTHDRTLGDVQRKADDRRRRAQAETAAKYADPGLAFRLHETKSKLDEVRREVEAKREAELDFDRPKASKPPRLPTKGADVKLNTAAVLREAHRVRQKQAKEADVLRQYETELRDASEFHAWQEQARAKDEEARLRAVEARRVEMADAARAGAEAAAASRASRARVAEARREEARIAREQQRLEREAQEEANRALASDVRETRLAGPRAAEREVRNKREARARALRVQKQRMADLVKQRRAQEEALARDRKMQLQALEKAPKPRVTAFDPAQSAGHGLLCEMSMVEARERIEMRKAREREAEEERRQAIRRERREKEDRLRGHLEAMRMARGAAAEANQEARREVQERRARQAKEEAERLEAAAETLAERLAAKRTAREAEQLALQEEEAKSKRRAAFLGAAAAAVEKRRLGQGQLNAERAAAREQQKAKERARVEERAARRKVRDRARAEQVGHRERVRGMSARARRFAEADEERADFAESQRQAAKEAFIGEAAREARLQAAKASSNVYAATITEKHAEDARRRRAPWLESREEQRQETMQGRLGRLSEQQAMRTGMAQTAARVRATSKETKRRADATLRRSALETAKLAKGMGASRTREQRTGGKLPGRMAGTRSRGGAGAGGRGSRAGEEASPVSSKAQGTRGRGEEGSIRASAAARRGAASVLLPVPAEAATWSRLS